MRGKDWKQKKLPRLKVTASFRGVRCRHRTRNAPRHVAPTPLTSISLQRILSPAPFLRTVTASIPRTLDDCLNYAASFFVFLFLHHPDSGLVFLLSSSCAMFSSGLRGTFSVSQQVTSYDSNQIFSESTSLSNRRHTLVSRVSDCFHRKSCVRAECVRHPSRELILGQTVIPPH